jgi:hypothetical protein
MNGFKDGSTISNKKLNIMKNCPEESLATLI